ncbi:hypothetical protein Rs2_42397 [Raphanus sativus]|nr:hypothetical protein Rs2_42397 [Raphanus sativus]
MDAHVLKPQHRQDTRRTSIESRSTDRGRRRRKRNKLLLHRISPKPEPPRRTTSIPELKLGGIRHRDSPEIASRASRSIFFSSRLPSSESFTETKRDLIPKRSHPKHQIPNRTLRLAKQKNRRREQNHRTAPEP